MEPDTDVTVTNLDGETARGRVVEVLDEPADEREAPFLDADGATLVDYWRGTDVAATERVVRVELGQGVYDYPESRVEPVEADDG